MARTVAGLPEGCRVSDLISMGVMAERIPVETVQEVLRREGRQSQRIRLLPAHVVVYYVVALALYREVSYGEVLRCLVEGLSWLGWPVRQLRQTGRSGISHARTRLGYEPMKRLYEEIVHPIATERTRGAWYGRGPDRRGWRLVSLDGTTLDLPDEAENREAFGRPKASRGQSAVGRGHVRSQLRFVTLAESGTHVLFGAAQGAYATGERTLAREVVSSLRPGMLCLADRNFFSFDLWGTACATGADLLWRVTSKLRLLCLESYEDGSYRSALYGLESDRKHERNGTQVRVVEYSLKGEPEGTVYRLVTSVLDPGEAPAAELAALYHERWEIETAFDEFKTQRTGPRPKQGRSAVLRSKTADLVRQEFYGLLLAHWAVRGLMHEAALQADVDPDRLSFVHSVRVIRRRLQEPYGPATAPFPPSTHRHPT